jgi:hypothetical protein
MSITRHSLAKRAPTLAKRPRVVLGPDDRAEREGEVSVRVGHEITAMEDDPVGGRLARGELASFRVRRVSPCEKERRRERDREEARDLVRVGTQGLERARGQDGEHLLHFAVDMIR